MLAWACEAWLLSNQKPVGINTRRSDTNGLADIGQAVIEIKYP